MNFNRDDMLDALRGDPGTEWDMLIIGGGATGLGVAVDAASRGYRVALVEASDFAKATSSRSTKLIHGGVRYLQQGNVSLVMESLRERGVLRRNAPHLVRDLAFIVPSYEWWESPFYGVGLKVYDLLAGRYGFGRSGLLSRDEVIAEIPSIQTEGLRGGTRYYDGQFDDARLALNLAQTAAEHGATVANYAPVVRLHKDSAGAARGAVVRDEESGSEFELHARVVVNATGPFCDRLRRLDHPDAAPIITPSQGVHIVLDSSFLPGESAIMVPHTRDDRVMFAIPWHDVAVIGTTDTPIEEVLIEPRARPEEIDFILDTANRYLTRPATRADIRSVFTGVRPLVRQREKGGVTAALSRDHTIIIDPDSGLLSIAGGKWTTYRKMAEDVVDQAADLAGLDPRRCITKELAIHGHDEHADAHGRLDYYGADATAVERLTRSEPKLAARVHPNLELTAAEVVWACRSEMARTVDDVLARRSRSLLFDAVAASEAAGAVAALMAGELGHDDREWVGAQLIAFQAIAALYRPI